MEVNIFGSGISGLTVAHELIEKGFKVTIYEKDSVSGGMARSLRTTNNVPTEHSWRGYGPFYYNTFDIMKRIPYNKSEKYEKDRLITTYNGDKYDLTDFVKSHPGGDIIWKSKGKDLKKVWKQFGYDWHENNEYVKQTLKKYKIKSKENYDSKKNTVYNNLSKKGITFNLLKNNSKVISGLSIKDVPYVAYKFGKVFLSDNRRRYYYNEKLDDDLKNNLSEKSYHFLVDYISGPGFGLDKNTMSTGHYGEFVEYNLQNYKSWTVLNQPTNEGWIDPWVDFLKSKGVTFVYNAELSKINVDKDEVSGVSLSSGQNISGDIYVICLNPFEYEKVLKNSDMQGVDKYSNLNIQNNQISFRIGFDKEFKFPNDNDAFVLVDSPYNITFYSQGQHWIDDVKLGMNGDIKTLWSGTCVLPYREGSLYGKSATALTIQQLKQEIIYQLFESNQLFDIIKKNNNGILVTQDDIIFSEIFDDFYESQTGLKTKNKKWVNNFINNDFRPENITNFNNLYVAGSHTKTSINIWSMEGAVESGKLASNIILKKYNKKSTYVYNHRSSILLSPFQILDNLFYMLNLPNILDVIILFGVVILFYHIIKKYRSISK